MWLTKHNISQSQHMTKTAQKGKIQMVTQHCGDRDKKG